MFNVKRAQHTNRQTDKIQRTTKNCRVAALPKKDNFVG